MLGYLQ